MAKSNPTGVSISTGELTLPTYELLGENRNPVFRSQYGVAHIYPYTLQDEIASTPSDVAYRTLILENPYLRVTVLPDLGGRVYSVYDKISKQEVFYKNPTVKFSPLAIRGAFFSGGVEFSFPVAHAPTSASPVNWDMRENEDGSASIFVGGLEHMSGMRWVITLTLYPDRCALAQDVMLFNPSPLPGRYHYWTNASLISAEDTEFIYPLQRVRSYEFAGTSSWPVARLDLIGSQPGLPGMEGVPMWPADRMHDPIDFHLEKDMLAQVSIFGRDVDIDFFGAWQHASNTGYAHYAKAKDVSGMKLWSWGRSDVGIVNQSALTDDGSVYAETQCGAMETQLDFDFLPPGVTRSWREWWLPLREIGGLTCASADLGARISVNPKDGEKQVDLTVGICPAYPLQEALVELSTPDEVLIKETVSSSPNKPWKHTRTVAALDLAGHALTLRVTDPTGTILLEYTHDRQPNSADPPELSVGESPETSDDFYQLGLRHENLDNREQALDSYRKSLDLFDDHREADLQLGLMLLRAADFAGARTHFRRAAQLELPAAEYYLGLISRYQGQLDAAAEHFSAVPSDHPLHSASLCGLGCLALKDERWKDAIDLFRKASGVVDYAPSAGLLTGMALRRAGTDTEATLELEQVLLSDPLNLPALRELTALEQEHADEHSNKMTRLLADDPQGHLDLASFYLDCGLALDALSILEGAAENWDYAMVSYLAAWISHMLGEERQAASWAEKAAHAEPDYVFPSRLWEVIALEQQANQNSQDFKAKYYLGNFQYSRQRYDEAAQLWEETLEGLGSYDILHRNLGIYHWQRQDDAVKATAAFERALDLKPENQDLYLLLDTLYAEQDLAEKRAKLLSRMRKLDPIREDLRKRIPLVLVDLDRYDEALDIFAEEDFVPLEMDQSFHLLYARALLMRAETHMAADQITEAIADYELALQFPENHGVGRPTTSSDAQTLYRLGCAYEQLGQFGSALEAWRGAAQEHHPFGDALFEYVQMSLDKLGRYVELGVSVKSFG
jgi:tetratricopeptide (TPR) repeat protein